MLSFQTPSAWPVVLSVPVNSWEPHSLLAFIPFISSVLTPAENKATVKLCHSQQPHFDDQNAIVLGGNLLFLLSQWIIYICRAGNQAVFSFRQHLAHCRTGAPKPKWCPHSLHVMLPDPARRFSQHKLVGKNLSWSLRSWYRMYPHHLAGQPGACLP